MSHKKNFVQLNRMFTSNSASFPEASSAVESSALDVDGCGSSFDLFISPPSEAFDVASLSSVFILDDKRRALGKQKQVFCREVIKFCNSHLSLDEFLWYQRLSCYIIA